MKYRRTRFFALFLGLGTSVHCWSQPEEIIVTGTMTAQSMKHMISSVTVFDRTDIVSANKPGLAEFLGEAAGVLVESQGGAGGLVSISLRGGEPNFTTVMVDGVQLNDSVNTRGGSFDFGHLNPDTVERIEIVRGAQAVVYGSDALSGVINIITIKPRPGRQMRLRLERGEYGYHRETAVLSGGSEELGYKLQVSGRDSGEPVSGSRLRSDDVDLGLYWKPNHRHSMSIKYRYADGNRSSYPEQGGGPLFSAGSELYRSNYTHRSVDVSWKHIIDDYWQSHINASHYESDESHRSPGIAPYGSVPPNGDDTDFQRTNLRWVNRIGNERQWLNVGMDWRGEDGRSAGYVDMGFLIPTEFALERSIRGVFIDLNGWVNDRTLVQASIRHDKPDDLGSQSSHKAGVKYFVSDALALQASWGTGYKLPSFFALGHSLTGNPDLKMETAETWDLTIDWSGSFLHGSLTYFHNHYDDLITFDDLAFANINSDPIDTRGVEWQGEWRFPGSPVLLHTEITYTDIEPDNRALRLTGRPRLKGGLAIRYPLAEGWQASLGYRYRGREYAGSQHTGIGTVEKLASHQLVDIGLSWQLTPALMVKAHLDNAFNERYQNAVGFPGEGRMLRLSFDWSIEQQ